LVTEEAWIRGDASRLEQVFCNLLTNAIKFTPEGGLVAVHLYRTDSNVFVSVEDTGQGIAPEFLPQLFERFRQADGSTARRYGGLGLGLAIVKQLVELHGGSVRAESGGPGRGSSFVVSLPSSEAAAGSAAVALSADVDLAGTSILVVDDDGDTRVAIERMLTDRDAKIETAASADEALERVRRVRASILISDIGMPGKDGYELIREIRRLPDHAHVRSIALTAFARQEDRIRALQAGYDRHLSKPVNPRELLTALAALLQSR
jgi:CheY-like chemotaxis protein